MKYSKSVDLPVSASVAFAWHERDGAFSRLLPPWERVRVLESDRGLADGHRVALEVAVGPLSRRWVAEIRDVVAGRGFSDVQLEGPFRAWRHDHSFEPLGDDRCVLTDEIEYELPGGRLGEVAAGAAIERKLDRLFTFRHAVTRRDLATFDADGGSALRRIVVTGGSGLVGAALVSYLRSQGHTVACAVRHGAGGDTLNAVEDGTPWDVSTGELRCDDVDAVVHLAGENIASRRWSAAQMEAIRSSRVGATRALCERLASRERKPKVLVVASAVGFYGDRGTTPVDETSDRGTGFLADVCAEWEAATAPAVDAGIRVVHLRFGMILDPNEGALARMLTPFKLGAGGRIGSGEQMVSWVTREDAVRAAAFALFNEAVEGPINVAAPNPVANAEFTRALGRALRRPTILPMPAFMARLAFGRMADELLLSGAAVRPSKLLEHGFEFEHPTIDVALRDLLGREKAE